MSEPPTAAPRRPAGYRSQADKRRFTITAGILGAVFFVLQFVVPMTLMMVLMPLTMIGFEPPQMRSLVPDRAVFWRGRVWAVRRSLGPRFPKGGRCDLVALDPDDEEPVEAVANLPLDDPWLLASDDGLWLVGDETIARYDGEAIRDPTDFRLGDVSRPFAYRGRPAVVERRLDAWTLRVFRGRRWEVERNLDLRGTRPDDADLTYLRCVAVDGVLHVFVRWGETIYCRSPAAKSVAAVHAPASADPIDAWTPVAKSGADWTAFVLDGRPALVVTRRGKDSPTTVTVLQRRGRDWREVFAESAALATEVGACPTPDGFALLLAWPFSTRLLEVADGAVVRERRYGSGFPFPKGFPALILVPQLFMFLMPLLLAVVLSVLMARHRVTRFESDEVPGAAAEYAPLWRRAAAQVVDGVVLAWPFAIAFGAMVAMFSDFEALLERLDGGGPPPLTFFLPHILACAGFPWVLLCLFAFAFLEGRFGATPGKWLLKIRVLGTDLEPCGFGRGLVRNLLKVVDGFFNFMVGVLLVALTENWQRVGDLAARTVVVMRSSVPPDDETPAPAVGPGAPSDTRA